MKVKDTKLTLYHVEDELDGVSIILRVGLLNKKKKYQIYNVISFNFVSSTINKMKHMYSKNARLQYLWKDVF